MGKPTICIGENKGTDQLRSKADQRLCFRYTDSKIPLHFQPLSICDCTARFVSDLVRNPNCWFSHAQAQMLVLQLATWSKSVIFISIKKENKVKKQTNRKHGSDCKINSLLPGTLLVYSKTQQNNKK